MDIKKLFIGLSFLLVLSDRGMNISYAQLLKEDRPEPMERESRVESVVQRLNLEPALTVTEKYDDNINLSSGPRDHDYITTLAPRLTLSYKGLIADLSFGYNAAVEFYSEHSNLNTVKHMANFSAGYRLSRTLQLKIQDGFVYSPDATDIDPTGIVTPRTDQFSNGVSLSLAQQMTLLTSVTVVYSYGIQRYEGSSLIDSSSQGVQLAIAHELTRADTITTNAGFRYLSFDDAVGQKVYTLSLGWKHRFSETLSLDAAGGANLYQDANNDYTPSGLFNVSLRKSWKDASADLTYLQDLTVSGRLESNALVNRSVVLGLQKTFTGNLRANLSGTYATNTSVSGGTLDTASYSGAAGFDYDFSTWLKGQIRYSYFQQDSHGTAGRALTRNQAFVGLTATFPN